MRRREFIALMGASVAWPFAAMAQQGRTYRLGVLFAGPRSLPTFGAMIEELRRFGFIEGKNLTIDFRSYASHTDLIPEYAAELVKAHVDVILVTEMLQFVLHKRRRKQFRSSRSPTIWLERAGGLDGPARRQYNRCQHPRDRA